MTTLNYDPALYDMRIKAHNLSTFDQTATPLLDNVSLTLNQGEYISIEGESGAGKSLFATALCGIRFDVAEDGNPDDVLRYNGTVVHSVYNRESGDVIDLPDGYNVRHRLVGFVPQDANMIDHLTAADNILTPLKIKRVKPDTKLLDAICHELDIADLLNKKVNNLAGGQKQRISIARGFATGPRFVFLDEPTANLHGDLKRKTSEQLGRIVENHGTTVVTITHDEPLAWRRITMRDGKIISDK